MNAVQRRSLLASCSAYRAKKNDFRRAAVFGLTFRGKEDPTC